MRLFLLPAALCAAIVAAAYPVFAEGDFTQEPDAGQERQGRQPQTTPPSDQRGGTGDIENPRPPPSKAPELARPGAKAKGDPGMMGLPWPHSPEEAEKALQNLYAFLATAGDHRLGGEIGASIEKLWRLQGGDTVNLLLDRAEAFTARTEFDKAMPLLDAAVDLAPDYADAFNRRAYTFYRMGNLQAALSDLRRALVLEPNHFRAMDGMAKILTELGDKKNALKAYQELLRVHPEIEGGKEAAEELRKDVEGDGI